jgi:hypothetical protein
MIFWAMPDVPKRALRTPRHNEGPTIFCLVKRLSWWAERMPGTRAGAFLDVTERRRLDEGRKGGTAGRKESVNVRLCRHALGLLSFWTSPLRAA